MGLKNIFQNTIARASIILAVFTLVAKLTGLLRDRVLASQFGASSELDIYYSAFKIPDFVFNLFILGAVSSAFIPVFIEHYQKDKQQAWRLAKMSMNAGLIFVIFASVIIFIFADLLAPAIAPGFSAEDLIVLARLLRIMLASTVLFSISTIIGSILQAVERFTTYAIAPILYNLGIIFGALYLVPVFYQRGIEPVYALGVGVVIGAFWHLLVQLPAVLNAGFRFGTALSFSHSGLRQMFRLMIPRTIGIGTYSVGAIVINAFASLLGAGSIAVLNFAYNLQFVPISVIGVSIATATFPTMSADASSGRSSRLHRVLYSALKRTGVIVGAITVVMILFREPIVRILLKTGAFSGADVKSTATVLGLFMLGVVAQSLVPILLRAFYALQNTKTPVIISIVSMAVHIILAALFVFSMDWGVNGLALAYAIGSNINAIGLYVWYGRMYAS